MVIKFKVHSVLNFVVFQCDVILVNDIPFLQHDLVVVGAGLGRDEFLEVANGVGRVALDPDLFAQPVVAGDFDHGRVDDRFLRRIHTRTGHKWNTSEGQSTLVSPVNGRRARQLS